MTDIVNALALSKPNQTSRYETYGRATTQVVLGRWWLHHIVREDKKNRCVGSGGFVSSNILCKMSKRQFGDEPYQTMTGNDVVISDFLSQNWLCTCCPLSVEHQWTISVTYTVLTWFSRNTPLFSSNVQYTTPTWRSKKAWESDSNSRQPPSNLRKLSEPPGVYSSGGRMHGERPIQKLAWTSRFWTKLQL